MDGLSIRSEFSTATATLNAYGMNYIHGGTGTIAYTLPVPIPGEMVGISATLATSSQQAAVTCAVGVAFRSTDSTDATVRKATFADAGDTLLLHAYSSAFYTVLSNIGSVALATT